MTNRRKLIAPSLLSADFANLERAVRQAEAGGAGVLHVDVMDGHFVPNLTLGPPVIRCLRKITRLPLDVHLMIEAPSRSLQDYLDAGADFVSVHAEAEPHLHRMVTRIREAGRKAGVALNPSTPLAAVEEVLPCLDFVLLMSVNPGFGGQRFIETSLDKIRRLDAMIRQRGLDVAIEVDGGVDEGNIAELARAGVDFAVAGSAVYGNEDPAETIRRMTRVMV